MKDKYIFRREFTDMYGQTKTVEHTFEADNLSEIVEEFTYFLNGCSFLYVKDMIWVKDDGQETSVLGYEPETAEDLDQMSLDLQEVARKLY